MQGFKPEVSSMNIQEHPAFKELVNTVSQLKDDRRQELMNILNSQADTVLTVKDISEIVGVHELTVRRWIKSGELQATRIKGYKINPLDFAIFLESRKTKKPHDSGATP